ncbi:MAG: substrate-binding domain-containing protein [Kiritimatiellia bacterium]
MKPKVYKVLLNLHLAGSSCRRHANGVLRVSLNRLWDLHIAQSQDILTREILADAIASKIDGLITTLPFAPDACDLLSTVSFPIVVAGASLPPFVQEANLVSHVRTDNKNIGVTGARHLLSLGAVRSFGYVPSPLGECWSIEREAAFCTEISRHNRAAAVFRNGSASRPDDRRALIDWLRSLAKPAALLCANDARADQVLDACSAAKIQVPSTIAVLGVDNDEFLGNFSKPPLSSIMPDFDRQGFCAAQELVRLMTSRKKPVPRMIVCPSMTVVVRGSTRPFAPNESLVRRAQDLMERQALEGISADGVAETLGVSRRLLDLRFKEYKQTTVSAYLEGIRLKAVQNLLRASSANIQTIARQCGFKNSDSLRNLFRNRFGISVRDYRRKFSGAGSKNSG